MKKNIILYGILTILIVIALIIYLNNKSGTIKKELKDFAYPDTASVNKIFLANKENKTITLSRIGPGKWTVNNKYIARNDAIKNLLDAIASIQIKAPVPKSSLEQITKLLATRSVKVEIYANDKLVKVYYVGDPTPDNLGTYMILEKSSVPFIVHKPGFNGYLTIRYFTDEIEWRDVSIFPLTLPQVYSITVDYPGQKENSYQIIRKSPGEYELTDINNNKINYTDTMLIKETFISIVKSKIDKWLTYDVDKKIDSLRKTTPIATITVKTINGDKHFLTLYKKTNFYDKEPPEVDPDIMYGLINNKELTYCQYFIFDPILIKLSDLSKSQTTKKIQI
jgi:hypothetical protein